MVINLKSDNNLSGFYVVYEGSTNLEKKGWYGISHLMEHLVCKSFDHLQEDFDRDAIEWNAYTSSNEIVFYLTGLEDKISKYRNDFVDILTDFNMSKEQFENERKIVLEEYMDYFNEQTQAHYLNLNRKLFNDFNPIGLKEDLEKLKFIVCINFFELQYTQPKKIINVSKGKPYRNTTINFSNIEIDKRMSYGQHNNPLEISNNFNDKSSIIMLSPIIEEDFAYINFINAMLSLGLKSPLYQEVRENNGLVYYINCFLNRTNEQGIVNITTQTSNKNVDIVIDKIGYVLNNPSAHLTKQRFELVRDYYKTRKEKEEILRYKNVNQYINPEGWHVYDVLDSINLRKIKSVYDKYFNFGDFYISNDKIEFK
jgi:predicted Zn-dependent peptidase